MAIKGLGGYHLACDATNPVAVSSLRAAKGRPDKPFAVMVGSLAHARRLADISEPEAALLQSPAHPIVLLRARPDSPCDPAVAPANPLIGVMLPYAPIHHLLFEHIDYPLVMTSANHSGQPMVYDDVDAAERLRSISTAILTHPRAIRFPCDDSVVRVVGDRLLPVRRARGYAPIPVPLHAPRHSVLAVGAELKNTFCVTSLTHAWVSQHIGDMGNLETLTAFAHGVEQFSRFYDVRPDLVAADAHPAYLSSKWARTHHRERLVEVQHHHAHIAAVMAEHGCDPADPVIGFAFDGTGYGTDGTIWGGEVLVATASQAERALHLADVLLPGGDAAVQHPARVALAHLYAADIVWAPELAPVGALTATEIALLRQQLDRGVACVLTSSMGRLFDAVASLIGLRHTISYEAQAAIDLENVAATATRPRPYRFAIGDETIDPAPVLSEIIADLGLGVAVADIAGGFHLAVANLVLVAAQRLRAQLAVDAVVLSGGVFQNVFLTEHCVAGLRADGFDVLTHHLVPPNDGGLALGQAYIAAHRLHSSSSPQQEDT